MPQSTNLLTAEVGGQTINVASLEIIDLAHLINHKVAEIERLNRVACTSGFFYLDIQNDPVGKKVLAGLSSIYAATERYFDQPRELKMKDYREGQDISQDRGFKSDDCCETFEIAYDGLVRGELELPSILEKDAQLLKGFSESCHTACKTILSCLSDSLQLVGDERLEESHRMDKPSDSGLKLICEPTFATLADFKENLHTDSGTLSLTFCEQWGLHVEQLGAFIKPMSGYVVVNVANSLQRLSKNKFYSPKHRVTQPSDGVSKRYFLSYFLRPEHIDEMQVPGN